MFLNNIHFLDYLDPRSSRLFHLVPMSPDNWSSTIVTQVFQTSWLPLEFHWLLDNMTPVTLDKIITFWSISHISPSPTSAVWCFLQKILKPLLTCTTQGYNLKFFQNCLLRNANHKMAIKDWNFRCQKKLFLEVHKTS